MNRYIDKLECLVGMGRSLSTLSTCKRSRTSAMIFTTNCTHIHSIGYNGVPSGVSNDACTEVEGECGCVHAEINAIAKLDRCITEPCLLYTRTMTCIQCASLVVNTWCIVGVVWDNPYRNNNGLELILRHHIPAVKSNDLRLENRQGIIQNWMKNDTLRQRR